MFLSILRKVKGPAKSRLYIENAIPEFDQLLKEQSVLTWITKIEECATMHRLSENEIIHYSLPKLHGIAQTWYQGLPTVLCT